MAEVEVTFEDCWSEFKTRTPPRYIDYANLLKNKYSSKLENATSMLDIGAGKIHFTTSNIGVVVCRTSTDLNLAFDMIKNRETHGKSLDSDQWRSQWDPCFVWDFIGLHNMREWLELMGPANSSFHRLSTETSNAWLHSMLSHLRQLSQ